MGLTHMTKRADFKAAAQQGRRFRAFACTVQVRDRQDDETGLRLGLTATRQTGTAVERNRMRRRLRAAAESAFAPALARPIDVVLVARREALAADFQSLKTELERSLNEARLRKPASSRSRPNR